MTRMELITGLSDMWLIISYLSSILTKNADLKDQTVSEKGYNITTTYFDI